MKTTITILFLFTATTLFAQKRFTATLIGGANDTFIPDSLNLQKNKTGKPAYQYGLEVSYRVYKNFEIGTGMLLSGMSSEEIFKKIPDDEIFFYDTYVSHKLKYTEFPFFINYTFFADKKITPFLKLGYSYIIIKQLEDKVLKTDPTGHKNDFWAQFYNFTFKNETMFLSDMRSVIAGAGANFKLNDSFSTGIEINARRFFYYEFDTKRSNYTLSGNLKFSYTF